MVDRFAVDWRAAGLDVATAALLVAWAVAAQIAFREAGLWLSLFFPLAATLLSFACFTVLRAFGEGRGRGRAERQRSNLARYLPGALAGGRLEVEMAPLHKFTTVPSRVAPGHGACPGCGSFSTLHQFMMGIEGNVVLLYGLPRPKAGSLSSTPK